MPAEGDVRVPSSLIPSWVGTVTVRTAVEGWVGASRERPMYRASSSADRGLVVAAGALVGSGREGAVAVGSGVRDALKTVLTVCATSKHAHASMAMVNAWNEGRTSDIMDSLRERTVDAGSQSKADTNRVAERFSEGVPQGLTGLRPVSPDRVSMRAEEP
jgi:hypothetical protein